MASSAPQEITGIGFEKRHFRDAFAQPRGRLHRDGAAERVTDEIDRLGVVGQRSLDDASLIVERLRRLARPGGRAAVTDQIDGADAIAIFQHIHQPAHISRPRRWNAAASPSGRPIPLR